MKNYPFAFFGSSRFSLMVLDELEKLGLTPSLVVTTPDKPQGRKLVLTPTPVKEWAKARRITVLDPEKLDNDFVENLKRADNIKVFVVASYGKIIPASVINIPPRSTLNIHPSLLPKYRGASPLQSAILDDTKDTGITIMNIDEKMDHGPIVSKEKVHIDEWTDYGEFQEFMARKGAQLLARTMQDWIENKITAKDQDHSLATYTKKITKLDGSLNLLGDPYLNFRKIHAYHEWPGAYFFINRHGQNLRIKITKASYKKNSDNPAANPAGELIIEKVIPEGSKEMSYEDFRRGYMSNGN